jgi:formate dehydrogenase maturation protein FdhE
LKKPQLQASLVQLEEQIAQYKKFDQEYKATLAAEKAALKKSSEEHFAKELEESVATAKADTVAEAKDEQRGALLLISQFLRLAAVRRGDEDADAALDENMALEGLLSKVYTGDASAVETMVKIIQGSSERTASVNSELLATTCKSEPQRCLLASLLTHFSCRYQGCCSCPTSPNHYRRCPRCSRGICH